MTPEEKLCSRAWRMRNSAGVLWSILSFGFLTCVNFLVRGITSRNKLWISYGVVSAVVTVGLFIAISGIETGTKENPVQSTASTVWGWVWFIHWIAGMALSILTNRKWLLWKAHHQPEKWYVQAPVQNAQPAWTSGTPHKQPVQQRMQQPIQQAKNVNTMELGDFEQLGVEYAAARQILDTRPQVGQYTSFEHLLGSTRVSPHLLLPFRNALSFEPTAAAPSVNDALNRPRGGRTLDL
ncbi:helix-hairpin-helix domain-containing protein [Arthrobacter frigidicola]|nr:helix-hairpin-helix domain-containing protein [Arthrobacter frigidicola]